MNNVIVIEREAARPLAIRYPSQAAAEAALNGSLLIDDLCATDCTDCYLTHTAPADADLILPN